MFFDDEPMVTPPAGDDMATDTGAMETPAEGEHHDGAEAEAPAAE